MKNKQSNLDNYDKVGAIIDYENGNLNDEETIELFQHLLDSGLVWQLQGHYGRVAESLIEAGYIRRQENGKSSL